MKAAAQWGWKAFRRDHRGRLHFLFRGHEGSTLVPIGQWIRARRRWVTDGARQSKYRAGFHFFPDSSGCLAFDKLTDGKYSFEVVWVRQVAPKPRSRYAWLAVELFIDEREPKIKDVWELKR